MKITFEKQMTSGAGKGHYSIHYRNDRLGSTSISRIFGAPPSSLGPCCTLCMSRTCLPCDSGDAKQSPAAWPSTGCVSVLLVPCSSKGSSETSTSTSLVCTHCISEKVAGQTRELHLSWAAKSSLLLL